ncbi:hypothetical protein, partial [Allomuricauda sp. CP2A]|uniref:hypothetical protein n=1 Tax=Allomuricauda sp. CP2A TaxID=1848189 RepID=UPI001C400F91
MVLPKEVRHRVKSKKQQGPKVPSPMLRANGRKKIIGNNFYCLSKMENRLYNGGGFYFVYCIE